MSNQTPGHQQPASQQPYQQGPAYPQVPNYQAMPPQKPKKPLWKRWWMVCLYIVVAIILVVKVSGGGSGDAASTVAADTGSAGATASTKAAPAQKKAAAPAKKAGIGTPVTSSDLTFTVSAFKCGVSVDDGFQDLTPQGQFCKLSVTIANGGKDQATVDDDQIKVKDTKGNEYGTSSDTITSDGSIFLKQINPGNKITGVAYYDVPKGTTPVTAEFKGSLFGSPAEVALS